MDRKKLLIYGGVGAAGLVGLYLLAKSGGAKAAGNADDDMAGYYNPAILYTGYGANVNPGLTVPEPVGGSGIDIGDTLESALAVEMAKIAANARSRVNDNATALFSTLANTLGELGGGQALGNFFEQDGQTYLNFTTTLFNPKTSTPPPTLPAPAPPPPAPSPLSFDTGRGVPSYVNFGGQSYLLSQPFDYWLRQLNAGRTGEGP